MTLVFRWLSVLSLLMVSSLVYAQLLPESTGHECKGHGHERMHKAARASIASPREDDYDIKHLKFDIHLSDTSAAIWGNVTTTATVVVPSMAQYVFELADTMTIDSVVVNGVLLPVVSSGQVRTITLPVPLLKGALFTATVYYRGYPRDAKEVNLPGLHNDSFSRVTFTLAEPYFAHIWWPCKQSLGDKIDSMDMWITVPTGVKAGSNGVLRAVTPTGTVHTRYEWKSNYPIDYYLISVAVSRYDEYSYYMHFDNSDDSMLIMNYISKDTPNSIVRLKPWLDSTETLVNYLSSLFGRYPFWKEKYGHCYIPSGSNMEHQTMTSTRFPRLSVLVHELAHHWFGNLVTCGTWRDIWLNEGFATYIQFICHDRYDGKDVGRAYLRHIQTNTMSAEWGSIYNFDTADWRRMFDGRITYNKAAAVVHMLRFEVGSDELFFGALRTYLQQYAWGNATTEDLKKTVETHTGKNLDKFFEQWVYGHGYPIIDATWNQVSGAVFLRLDQAPAAPWSVVNFTTPIEVKFYSAQGDTTVLVNISETSHSFSFICSKTIDSIALDPNLWLLYKKAKDPARDINLNLLPTVATVYPNPSSHMLYVSYKDMPGAAFVMYDVAGRMVLEHKMLWDAGIVPIDISRLPTGVYIYRISGGGKVRSEGKVRKG